MLLPGGYWRPSCTATAVPVTVSHSDNDAPRLDARHRQPGLLHAQEHGTLLHAVTRAGWDLVTVAPWEYRDVDVLGNVDVNYTYVVRPACGAAWVHTGQRGEFEYGLIPGN